MSRLLIDDDDPAVEYTPPWHPDPGAYQMMGRSRHGATETGTKATLTFTGERDSLYIPHTVAHVVLEAPELRCLAPFRHRLLTVTRQPHIRLTVNFCTRTRPHSYATATNCSTFRFSVLETWRKSNIRLRSLTSTALPRTSSGWTTFSSTPTRRDQSHPLRLRYQPQRCRVVP